MDDTMHVVHPRAAGLTFHKMAITATVRLPQPGATAEYDTREVSACAIFTEIGPDLDAFPSADHLAP